MKAAVFQQFQVVPGTNGCHYFGLDQSGRLWSRFESVTNPELTCDWSLMAMPQRERKMTAWERLLQAQEDLRDDGRDVEVIEYGSDGDAPQSLRLGMKDADDT